jgi:hypothetical protein
MRADSARPTGGEHAVRLHDRPSNDSARSITPIQNRSTPEILASQKGKKGPPRCPISETEPSSSHHTHPDSRKCLEGVGALGGAPNA